MSARALRAAAVAIALAATLIFALSATAAFALAPPPAGPPIVVGAADYSAGTVHVSVEASTGLSAVHFEDGSGVALGDVTSPAGPTAGFDVPLHADMTVAAVGLDASSNPVWRSTAALKLADYVPGKPSLALAANALVGRQFSAKGSAAGGTTSMTLFVQGGTAWSGHVTLSGGRFSLPAVGMPYGDAVVWVRAENAFGQTASSQVRIWNLGTTVRDANFVLVDKSDFTLYYVHGRCVTNTFPVAIGMPGTPTHTGVFKLGPWRHTPSAVWGPRRMALMKKVGRRYKNTSYYIHGTNDPSSIGTMASHGCVRLHSSDAIKLSRIARWYTTQIRE